MLAWMLYAATIAALLGAAASLATTAARRRGTPSRFYWAASLAGSVVIPVAVSTVSIRLPAVLHPDAAGPALPLSDLTVAGLAPGRLAAPLLAAAPTPAQFDTVLALAWAGASIVLALALLLGAATLAARKRHWPRATLADTPVRVSPSCGPALAGWLRPEIVIPRWLLAEDAETHRLVIAHERAHQDAGDPRLFALSLAALVLMPWNLPLWWQIRALRLAIETDCDARVIRAGAPAPRYAETLVRIGERRFAAPRAALAMAETSAGLEMRLRTLLRPGRRTFITRLAGLGALALAGSVTLVSPRADEAAPPLALYAGAYRMGPSAVLTVTQDGDHLRAQLTGQGPIALARDGTNRFTATAVGATFDFTLNAAGQVDTATLRQNGQIIAMPRIEAGEAASLEASTKDRIARNEPVPGSHAAAQALVQGILSGSPDYSIMTPKLASVVRTQEAALHDQLAGMGTLRAVNFKSVGPQGQDIYVVDQEGGASRLMIVMADGKIAGARIMPAE